jgi:sugar phosphate isomerase/epimerase
MHSDRLGVQAHCLRHVFARDFDQGLAAVTERGLHCLELVSFAGCRGNPWGDFGNATDLEARAIGARLASAGVGCPSVMVHEGELDPERCDATLRWVAEVGCRRVVLTALKHPPRPTRADWERCFERLAQYARRCREAGFKFVIHTQPSLWAECDGELPAAALLQWVDPVLCRIEYDPSGAILHGIDPTHFIRVRPEVFYSLHLRDGRTPPAPVVYLPALPLGAGVVDWAALLAAAAASNMEWYFLEMEVAERTDVLGALDASLAFLHSSGCLDTRPRMPRDPAAGTA